MEPTILFEDDDLLVIDKPAGVTVNRSDTTKGGETIQDWSEEYLKIRSTKHALVPSPKRGEIRNNSEMQNSNDKNGFDIRNSDFEFSNRGGIVHRLDKETSGILLIAKNPIAFAHLQVQFKERTVKKSYLALAHGRLLPPDGEIRAPVGRLPWNRKQFGIVAGGRESVTRYKTIANFKSNSTDETLSLVELYPETGRTHQIRVHLKYIGYPIFADFLYAGRKTARDDRKLLSRVFLHAAKISFTHPTTHEHISFESPLPEDLQSFLESLEKVD